MSPNLQEILDINPFRLFKLFSMETLLEPFAGRMAKAKRVRL
jgi:hypothetical protein